MDLEQLKSKLNSYKKSDIIFTTHAEIRALGRGINLEEVKENIINPTKLVYAEKVNAKYRGEKNMSAIFLIQKSIVTNMYLQ